MAIDHAGLDWGIATALVDDAALMAELRAALYEDAMAAADLVKRSRCDANWISAVHRLQSLAASFGAPALAKASKLALELAPGDPQSIKAIEAAVHVLKPVETSAQ
jgi:HPt (histidine-containing phosphotransfer) domain-containing protein